MILPPSSDVVLGNSSHNDKQTGGNMNTKGGPSNGIFGGSVPSSSSSSSSSMALTYDQDIKLLGIAYRLPIFKRFSILTGQGSGLGPGLGSGPGSGHGPGRGPSPGSSHHGVSSNSMSTTSLNHTVIAKGSTLPGTRARPPHARISSLTQRPLQGVSVPFNLDSHRQRQENDPSSAATSAVNMDRNSYAGVNEVLAWKRVLSFAPDFTGQWID